MNIQGKRPTTESIKAWEDVVSIDDVRHWHLKYTPTYSEEQVDDLLVLYKERMKIMKLAYSTSKKKVNKMTEEEKENFEENKDNADKIKNVQSEFQKLYLDTL